MTRPLRIRSATVKQAGKLLVSGFYLNIIRQYEIMNFKMHTLPEKLLAMVEASPDTVIMQMKIDGVYQQTTYQQFFDNAQRITHFLSTHGIKPGDRVALSMKNSPYWGMIYFGILYAGAIAVPFDWQSKPEDIIYYLNDSESSMIFIQKDIIAFDKLFAACPALKQIIPSDKDATQDSPNISNLPELLNTSLSGQHHLAETIMPDDIASILYTSGTTGRPKGVMLTHQNFYSNFLSIEASRLLKTDENILAILPLHHSFPFTVTLLTPLFSKNKITYLDSLKSTDLIDCLQTANITILVGVPQLFYMLYKSTAEKFKAMPFFVRGLLKTLMILCYGIRQYTGLNLAKYLFKKIHHAFGNRLRYLVSGGAKLDPETKRFFIQLGFSLIEGYGLTETAPVATFNHSLKKINAVGKPVDQVHIKIESPDKQGIGEVLIQGPNVMKGYYHRDAETKAVLTDDGWFHSGDLGYIDRAGFVYLTGRKNELIVLSSGKNISPEEIESHYLKCPYIKELCVLSVRDESANEKLMAVIVPNLAYFAAHKTSNVFETIRFELENLSKQLPTYQRIMGFSIAKEELPRTRLGKLKRFEILEKYRAKAFDADKNSAREAVRYSEADQQLVEISFYQTLAQIIQSQGQIKNAIHPDDHFEIDLGFDSLGRVELITAVEQAFHIQFDRESIEKIFTVRELAELIQKQQPSHETIAKPPKSWAQLLHEDIDSNILKNVDLTPNIYRKITIRLIQGVLYFLSKGLFRLTIKNADYLPKNKAYILCANHVSYLDAPLIAAALSTQQMDNLYFLGLSDFLDTSFLKHFTKISHIIPINPNLQLVESLQLSTALLKQNRAICIFPEGERSIDGQLKSFKKGVGILAKELQVPLIPVLIRGAFEAWPRTKRFPRPHRIEIIFGTPYDAKELEMIGKTLGARDDYDAITLGIREKIEQLSSSNYF
ncbi:MAG TPA: hypothetical protein DIC51_05710 [Coxiellaceae bacterium]|nr:hypothetical protein [Coxiellaceae bacterium]